MKNNKFNPNDLKDVINFFRNEVKIREERIEFLEDETKINQLKSKVKIFSFQAKERAKDIELLKDKISLFEKKITYLELRNKNLQAIAKPYRTKFKEPTREEIDDFIKRKVSHIS